MNSAFANNFWKAEIILVHMKWQRDLSSLDLSTPLSGQEESGGRDRLRKTGSELKGKNVY